jgi:hypothetical protein
MIAFLLTPIGRYVAIGVITLVAAYGIYSKIRANAVAEIEAAATTDVLRRTQNAIHAGDNVNVSSERLREPDGHSRD